jgi:hypothetical protein
LIGIGKFHYEACKTPKEMTAAEYDKLPPKNNWTPEIKKGTALILVSDGDSPALLYYFAVGAVLCRPMVNMGN